MLLLSGFTGAQQVEDMDLSPAQLEKRLIHWVNTDREMLGLPQLHANPLLTDVARAHSRKMAQEKIIGHKFPDYPELDQRVGESGLSYSMLGENVARGDTFVMRFIHQALLESPGHRENIISRQFDHIGIGIVLEGEVYYITQVFASLIPLQSPGDMEQRLIFALNALLPEAQPGSIKKASDLQEFCRNLAAEFLKGNTDPEFPDKWSWGKAELVTYSFTEPHQITKKLEQELKSLPAAWIIGVAFGRSKINPGGCYAVTMLTFPNLLTVEDPDKHIFDRLNQIRSAYGKGHAAWFKPLADKAKVLAHDYQSGSLSRSHGNKFRIFSVYEGYDIDVIPDFFSQQMTRKAIRSLGVYVLYSVKSNPIKNRLVVAVVGN